MHPTEELSRGEWGASLSYLPIRTRISAAGDGSTQTVPSVFCPARDRSIDPSMCEECAHCVGIAQDLSDRSSFVRCVRMATPVEPTEPVAIGDIMARDVWCARPDLSIVSLIDNLVERNISGAPVVDEEGFPVGVISKTDLVRHAHDDGNAPLDSLSFSEELLDETTVSDLMVPLAFTLHERAPLAQAAAVMAYEGVHRIPVVCDQGTVVGLLSSLDIARWVATREGYTV